MIIAIKIIMFFLALWATIALIEDAIEKIILHCKKDRDELHLSYTQGYLSTFDSTWWMLTLMFWTGFYLLNQI